MRSPCTDCFCVSSSVPRNAWVAGSTATEAVVSAVAVAVADDAGHAEAEVAAGASPRSGRSGAGAGRARGARGDHEQRRQGHRRAGKPSHDDSSVESVDPTPTWRTAWITGPPGNAGRRRRRGGGARSTGRPTRAPTAPSAAPVVAPTAPSARNAATSTVIGRQARLRGVVVAISPPPPHRRGRTAPSRRPRARRATPRTGTAPVAGALLRPEQRAARAPHGGHPQLGPCRCRVSRHRAPTCGRSASSGGSSSRWRAA